MLDPYRLLFVSFKVLFVSNLEKCCIQSGSILDPIWLHLVSNLATFVSNLATSCIQSCSIFLNSLTKFLSHLAHYVSKLSPSSSQSHQTLFLTFKILYINCIPLDAILATHCSGSGYITSKY